MRHNDHKFTTTMNFTLAFVISHFLYKAFLHSKTPTKINPKARKAPCLESQNSVHVKGFVTCFSTFRKFSFSSSKDPVLSITISALVFFKSRGI